MPRPPASPRPSPISAPSCASPRSPSRASTPPKCAAARTPWRPSPRIWESSTASRCAMPPFRAPTSAACPPCSPRARPATGGRRSSCTRTTTCSRSATNRCGTRRRSSRPCATAASTAAAPPTTRQASWCTSARSGRSRRLSVRTSTSASRSSSRARRRPDRAPSHSSSPTTPTRCAPMSSSWRTPATGTTRRPASRCRCAATCASRSPCARSTTRRTPACSGERSPTP